MIKIDRERNTTSLLLWFLSEIMNDSIMFQSYSKSDFYQYIRITLSNSETLKVITMPIMCKILKDCGIKVIKYLLDLSANGQLVFDDEIASSYETSSIQIFSFSYSGNIKWPPIRT